MMTMLAERLLALPERLLALPERLLALAERLPVLAPRLTPRRLARTWIPLGEIAMLPYVTAGLAMLPYVTAALTPPGSYLIPAATAS